MSESADYIAQLPRSPHTAEELLSLLIQLITSTTNVEDLSDDVIEATFGIQLDPYEEDKKDYAARLTREWNVGIVASNDALAGRILELGFFDSNEDTVAPMTEICGVDAQSVGAALVEAAYKHSPVHGVHGEHKGHKYERGTVQVLIQTRGEASRPQDKTSHECVTSIWIRHG